MCWILIPVLLSIEPRISPLTGIRSRQSEPRPTARSEGAQRRMQTESPIASDEGPTLRHGPVPLPAATVITEPPRFGAQVPKLEPTRGLYRN
jgi:hypothetical protein